MAAPVGLRGASLRSRWNTARDLFGKVSQTMPADKIGSLTAQEYVDVVAYLIDVNGGEAGAVPLTSEPIQLQKLRIRAQPDASAGSATSVDSGYFSARQAERGAGFFEGSCSLCHTVDRNRPPLPVGGLPESLVPVDIPQGLALGSGRFKFNLAGADFVGRYSTVAELFLKLATTMPGYDAHGLTAETYLDISAYLLRENGWHPGPEDLTDDLEAMHAMPLLEPGFTALFNGKDLSGWHVLLGHNCTPPPAGCGSAQAGSTFQVAKRSLHVSGRPLGYLYSDKKYLNFALRMDFRFVRYEGIAADEPFFGNSGWLLFVQNNQVWPKMIEIQGMQPRLLDILPVDAHAKFTVDAAARQRALQRWAWNAIEIVSNNGRVEVSLNGVLVSIVTEHEFKEPGYLGLESEGARILFRNIRIREL